MGKKWCCVNICTRWPSPSNGTEWWWKQQTMTHSTNRQNAPTNSEPTTDDEYVTLDWLRWQCTLRLRDTTPDTHYPQAMIHKWLRWSNGANITTMCILPMQWWCQCEVAETTVDRAQRTETREILKLANAKVFVEATIRLYTSRKGDKGRSIRRQESWTDLN